MADWRRPAGIAAVAALVLLTTGVGTPPESSPLFPQTPTVRDLRYADDPDPAHRLDLYLPLQRSGPFPLVVFVHGGAWSYGDKAMPPASPYGQLRRILAERGYAVASVQYRFVSQAPFPAQLHDVTAAIRYLRAHAAEYGLDPDRFAVAGDSAGGELAQLVGLTAGQPYGPQGTDLQGAVGTPGVSSAVRAVVSFYGVSDLVRLFDDRAAANCRSNRARGPATAEGKLVHGDPEAGPGRNRAIDASGVTYAAGAHTPVLLLHGTEDCLVPPAQSKRLYDALRQAGTPAELKLIPAGHSAPAFYTDPELQQAVLNFLDTYVRGGSAARLSGPATG